MMPQSVLNIAEITIRPLHPDDAADLYVILSHPQVARMTLRLPSMEQAEMEQRVKTEKAGRHRLVAEWQGRVLGVLHLSQNLRPRIMHSGRIGLTVHPDAWGQGVGGQLLEAGLNLADGWLNLNRLELEVFTHNQAGIHLFEKFGFEQEGVRRHVAFGNGRFLDDIVMARLHGTFPGPAHPPPAPNPLPPSTFAPDEVVIRPLHLTDADDLFACFSHPLVARTTLQMTSQEIGTTKKRVETRRAGLHRYVADLGGKAVGQISLYQSDKPRLAHTAGLGMMVHPAYWDKGIGSQLMAAAVDLADNWLNLSRIDLEVNVDNPAGVRLYHKFGFEIEGTKRWHAFGDGRLADSYFMARLRPGGNQ